MQSGNIIKLQVQHKKELPSQEVSSLEMAEGMGIFGDCHSIGGEKQVALISSETKKWMETQSSGLCMKRFHENLVTQGIDYSLLECGDQLETDTIMLQISAYSKRCFSECELVSEKKTCKLKTGILFAKVMKSGMLYVGDPIWTNKCDKQDNESLL